MPGRRKKGDSSEEESEWEHDDSAAESDDDVSVVDSEDSNDEAFEQEEEEEDYKKQRPPKPRKKQSAKKSKRKPLVQQSSDEEADFEPTHTRLTARGGYSHTRKSKSRISRANQGNTPWNKGKNRSMAVRAKISAGVRARNRSILLKKLGKLGMSEEEYNEKRKQIRLVRERLRITKLQKTKRNPGPKPVAVSDDATAEAKGQGDSENSPNDVASTQQASDDDSIEEPFVDSRAPALPSQSPTTEIPSIFAPEIEWTRHEYDNNKDGAYKKACPTGGPGGLICCQVCMKSYSQYLCQATRDMEKCRTENARKEVTELLAFARESRVTLQKHVRLARRQPPPPIDTQGGATRVVSSKKSSRKAGSAAAPLSWNATSSIDIGALGPSMRI